VVIIEDDAYGFLDAGAPPSFAHLAPDIAYYIYSLSKPVAPGVRTAFLHVPHGCFEPAAEALRLSSGGTVPLLGSAVYRWLQDGTVASWIEAKRAEGTRRQRMAEQVLAGLAVASHPTSYHVWLTLPGHRTVSEVVSQLAARQISVVPAGAFTVAPAAPPNALRLSLGGEMDVKRVANGLSQVASLMRT
jgi:DNA-binding transcriptional MocR family regulator